MIAAYTKLHEQQRAAALTVVPEEPRPSVEPTPPKPEPVPEDPAVLEARAKFEAAQAVLTEAEARYAAKATKENWAAVQTAAQEKDKAVVVLRQIEARLRREIAERVASERARLRDRYLALCERAGETQWRADLLPLMAAAAKLDLEQWEIARQLEQIARDQSECAWEAARLAKELNDVPPPPRARDTEEARAYLGYAIYDARGERLPSAEAESARVHWFPRSTQHVRSTRAMAEFLDQVKQRVLGGT